MTSTNLSLQEQLVAVELQLKDLANQITVLENMYHKLTDRSIMIRKQISTQLSFDF